MRSTRWAILLLSVLPALLAADTHELAFQSGETSLKALLHTPDEGPTESVLVYLHGNPGSPLAPESWIVEPLLDAGVAVFRFNYRGLWGNEGDFNLSNGIEDLRHALDFLTDPEALRGTGLAPRQIYLFGYSFGTAVALSGGHDDDRIAGIALLAPCDHGYFGAESADPESPLREFLDFAIDELFGEGGPIQEDPAIFVDDLEDHSEAFRFPPYALALRDKRLLFFVGIDDRVCFAEDHFFPLYRALRSTSHPAIETVVLAMDHGMRPVGREAIAKKLAHWVAASAAQDLSTMKMSNEELEAFALSYTAAWNSGDPAAVAEHYGERSSLSINGGEAAVGREALTEVAASFMTGFPDLVLTFDSLAFEGGRVNYHWTFRGTNTGPDGTGRRVDFSGFESWVFGADGLIDQSLGTFDAEDYQRQLAGIPDDGARKRRKSP